MSECEYFIKIEIHQNSTKYWLKPTQRINWQIINYHTILLFLLSSFYWLKTWIFFYCKFLFTYTKTFIFSFVSKFYLIWKLLSQFLHTWMSEIMRGEWYCSDKKLVRSRLVNYKFDELCLSCNRKLFRNQHFLEMNNFFEF